MGQNLYGLHIKSGSEHDSGFEWRVVNVRSAKQKLRERYFRRRKLKSTSGKDDAIRRNLVSLVEYIEVCTVLLYVPTSSEAGNVDMVDEIMKNKRVALPRVSGRGMIFHVIEDLGQLERGFNRILEPTPSTPRLNESHFSKSTIVVPGVVFDVEGHRIGQGGGFYDRFMSRDPFDSLPRVALAYDCQVLEETIPHEEFDRRVDKIVTQSGIVITDRGKEGRS